MKMCKLYILSCCSAAVILNGIHALLPSLLLVLVSCLPGSGCLAVGRVLGGEQGGIWVDPEPERKDIIHEVQTESLL